MMYFENTLLDQGHGTDGLLLEVVQGPASRLQGRLLHSLPRPTAVAFDLDGTLIDTEAILIEAQRRTLMAFGIHALASDHPRTFGMGMEPGVGRLCEFYGLDYVRTLEVFRSHWVHLSATELTPMPGARTLLTRLKSEGVRMALVTSADPVHAQNALKALDVPGAFQFIIDADMVASLKPSPEPYLKAAEDLAGCGRMGLVTST